MARFPGVACLEVERKFAALTCYPLQNGTGRPPFSSLRDLTRQRFHDIYYDSDSRLSRAGTWLRQRDGVWQMKLKTGGTYTNSQFQEIVDVDVISARVHLLTGLDSSAADSFGLRRLARFTTTRQTWEADDEFKVVLDHTDFGHTVGEVELEDQQYVWSEEEARRLTQAMDDRIVRFLQHYSWAFCIGKPIGKLQAYLTASAPDVTGRAT